MSFFLEELRLQPHYFKIADTIIELKGPDAVAFLHAQSTQNTKDMLEGSFHFDTLLDRVGKIVSGFLLIKESKDHLILALDEYLLPITIERIEKYHIAEDFEVTHKRQNVVLAINENKLNESYKGKYFFENDQVLFTDGASLSSRDLFHKLKVVTGIGELGAEVNLGELFNNTFYDACGIDYKKGCFLGQETVAKINSRRGAAYKPVLLVLDVQIELSNDIIQIEGAKIGEIKSSFILEDKTYCYAMLSREYRIDQSEITIEFKNHNSKCKAKVNYYPYLSPLKKDLAVALYDHAVELFHQGLDEEAIEYFNKSINSNPQFEDAYESLGVLYGRLENYEKAIELMENLRTLNPKSMMAHTNLSLYHMKLGHIDIAEKFKADATVLNFEKFGDEAKIKKEKEALEKQKLFDRERREGMFLQILEMDPEDAMANNGMGEILFEKNEFKNAAAHFEKAIIANKKYSVAYLGLAKSYYQQNNFDKCREVLTLGIQIASKNGDLMPANEMQALLSKLK